MLAYWIVQKGGEEGELRLAEALVLRADVRKRIEEEGSNPSPHRYAQHRYNGTEHRPLSLPRVSFGNPGEGGIGVLVLARWNEAQNRGSGECPLLPRSIFGGCQQRPQLFQVHGLHEMVLKAGRLGSPAIRFLSVTGNRHQSETVSRVVPQPPRHFVAIHDR